MTLSLLAAVVLTASPAVVLTHGTRLGQGTAPAVLGDIERELRAAGLVVLRVDLDCEGRLECLAEGGGHARTAGVISVSLVLKKKQTTVDLEAVRVSDASSLSHLTFAITEQLSPADAENVRAFGRSIAALLPSPAEPAVFASQPEVSQSSRRSTVPVWCLSALALGASATSVGLLANGASLGSRLNATPEPSPLTRSEAQRMVVDANRSYSFALAAGITAGVLALAAVLWAAL